MTEEDAKAFAADWIDAFNAHDADRILALYSVDVELTSPLYARFTGGRSDTVRGIAELRAYFAAALERYPELRFTHLETTVGTGSLCVRYRSNLGDKIAVECFELDAALKARRVLCHYLPAADA